MRKDKNNLNLTFHLIIIIVLIISLFHVFQIKISPSEYASGGTSRLQNIDLDIKTNTLNNIIISPSSEIKLELDIRYIEDDFINDSKIESMNGLLWDALKEEIKLAQIENTFYKIFGGNDIEYGNYIELTADGGYIITGATMSITPDDFDLILLKIDSSGNELWNKTFAGAEWDFGYSVQQTADGGYIIIGFTYTYGAGHEDIWLIKTDSNGNMEWDRTFGGSEYDRGNSVQQTSDGGYILTGYTQSFGAGGHDVWLIKTNSTGFEEWNKTFGGNLSDRALSVQQTNDNGFIITGSTWSFKQIPEIWLIKTNNSGDMEWNKTLGGYVGVSLQQTSDNGFIITGSSRGDVYLIKTNNNGLMQWNKTYGGNEDDIGHSVQQTSDGDYILTGYTTSFGLGFEDLWLIKTDGLGNMQWNKTIGSDKGDRGWSVKQTMDNGYVIVGDTLSYGAGETDILLIKTDSNGNLYSDGELISKNLLIGQKAYSINFFNCTDKKPFGSSLKVQFSQDKFNWYNSRGLKNDWDVLGNGVNSIDLIKLAWQGSSFYYKMNFSTSSLVFPVLQNINISFSKYFPLGSFESKQFNSNEEVIWKTINWNSMEPSNTKIQFQIRSASVQSEFSSKIYLGPDGTTETYYTLPGESIWVEHNKNVWIQYKAYLSATDTSQTPVLKRVNISYKYIPKLESPKMTPSNGDIKTIFNFSIIYHNKNNESPVFIKVSLDSENHSMFEMDNEDLDFSDGKGYWFSSDFNAGEHSYQFYASDGEIDTFSDLFTFYVEFGSLDHINIQPSTSEITTDEYLIFSAEGYDDDNNSIPIYPKWSVNGGGLIDQNGNFTASKTGIWTVYANYSGITGRAIIIVTFGTLDKIIISPQLELITTDDFLLFNATGYDKDNNILPIKVKWEITGGGTIDQNGNFTPTTPGEWLVYANISEKSGLAMILVEEGNLNKITIFPNSTKINVSESTTFTAKGYDLDNNELYIYPRWEISGGGTINRNGVFTGTKPGIWIVYANKSGISSTATVKVITIEDEEKTDEDQTKEKKDNPILYIGIGIIIIVIIILILYLFIFKKKFKKDKKPPEKPLQLTHQIPQNLQSEQSLATSESQNYQMKKQKKDRLFNS